MTIKEIAIKTIEELPEDATWDDIQGRINFVAGVRKGIRELDEGKGIAHKKVKRKSHHSDSKSLARGRETPHIQ